MRIVIPGGSGQVGTVLARAFHGDGHEVTILSRSPEPAPWRTLGWDARTLGPWVEALDGADVVINLAGRNVNCRYTEANRRDIMDSRVESTVVVGAAIARVKRPPGVWLQASTATIYAHRFDAPNDEATGIIGGNEPDAPASWKFSIEVAQAWERACLEADTPRTRRVLMRSAMVMSPDRGGIFDTMLRLVRLGLGGRAGDGRQYISWLHEADFIRSLNFLIGQPGVSGPVNLAAPNPLPQVEFNRALRAAWGMPLGLPAMRWMLPIGAWLMGSETELVLKSRRVVPGRMAAMGFEFAYPEWASAAKDLCQSWRKGANA